MIDPKIATNYILEFFPDSPSHRLPGWQKFIVYNKHNGLYMSIYLSLADNSAWGEGKIILGSSTIDINNEIQLLASYRS